MTYYKGTKGQNQGKPIPGKDIVILSDQSKLSRTFQQCPHFVSALAQQHIQHRLEEPHIRKQLNINSNVLFCSTVPLKAKQIIYAK